MGERESGGTSEKNGPPWTNHQQKNTQITGMVVGVNPVLLHQNSLHAETEHLLTVHQSPPPTFYSRQQCAHSWIHFPSFCHNYFLSSNTYSLPQHHYTIGMSRKGRTLPMFKVQEGKARQRMSGLWPLQMSSY